MAAQNEFLNTNSNEGKTEFQAGIKVMLALTGANPLMEKSDAQVL